MRPPEKNIDQPGPFYEISEKEVSILEVHKMAIEYAEVSPEKIRKWRQKAGWKALMPKLSMGFSESNDDNVEIYKSASSWYVVDGPREIDRDWSVDLTWDLSDLVWNWALSNASIDSLNFSSLLNSIAI